VREEIRYSEQECKERMGVLGRKCMGEEPVHKDVIGRVKVLVPQNVR